MEISRVVFTFFETRTRNFVIKTQKKNNSQQKTGLNLFKKQFYI